MSPKQADKLIGKTVTLTDVYDSSGELTITSRDRWCILGVDNSGHEVKIDRTDIKSWSVQT